MRLSLSLAEIFCLARQIRTRAIAPTISHNVKNNGVIQAVGMRVANVARYNGDCRDVETLRT